jgi:cell wall assembly regulator SMI1
MAAPKEIALVLQHWQSTNVPLNAGASLEQIRAVEKTSGLSIPGTLRLLYQEANGMPERETDSQFFYFWPIEQVVSEMKGWGVPANLPLLLFGDFLIASHAYGVFCAGPEAGSVHVFHGHQSEKVAGSLSEFFSAVVNDPNSVQLLRSRAV